MGKAIDVNATIFYGAWFMGRNMSAFVLNWKMLFRQEFNDIVMTVICPTVDIPAVQIRSALGESGDKIVEKWIFHIKFFSYKHSGM